jgi:glycosyltransferase involved in cell wall biosynthesis
VAIVNSRVRIHLRIVGDGPLRSSLEELATNLGIANSVTFEGTVDSARLGQAYAETDVFVLSAVEDAKGDVEGLGVVLIEAQMHGKPVIASDSGGIPDVVAHAHTGLLVPPGDVDALADAILLLSSDGDLRRRLGSAGRDHAVTHFSWDAIIDQLVGLYAELASRRGGIEQAGIT